MAYSGKYIPKNREKYKGNVNNVIYRSLWELRLFKYLDSHPSILAWNSEETVIPYRSPLDNKIHRYFIDATAIVRTKEGNIKKYLIEIKPFKQTIAPKQPKKVTASYKNAVYTYLINEAKWNAAKEFAKKKDYEFIILTENQLFGK